MTDIFTNLAGYSLFEFLKYLLSYLLNFALEYLILLSSRLFCEGSMLYLSFICIYVYWCPTPFPYHIMFVSFNSNTTGATSGARTTYPYVASDFYWGSCCLISCFLCGILYFVFCPLFFLLKAILAQNYMS